MVQFEARAVYAGREIIVKADTFAELHQALAGIEEMERDAHFLREKGVEDVIPTYRKDANENEYFGFKGRRDGRNVTFGKKREGGAFPFFPKGDEGYYDPAQGRSAPEQSASEQSTPAPRPAGTPAPNVTAGAALSAGEASDEPALDEEPGSVRRAQKRRLVDSGAAAGLDPEALQAAAQERFGRSVGELSEQQAEALIEAVEAGQIAPAGEADMPF